MLQIGMLEQNVLNNVSICLKTKILFICTAIANLIEFDYPDVQFEYLQKRRVKGLMMDVRVTMIATITEAKKP